MSSYILSSLNGLRKFELDTMIRSFNSAFWSQANLLYDFWEENKRYRKNGKWTNRVGVRVEGAFSAIKFVSIGLSCTRNDYPEVFVVRIVTSRCVLCSRLSHDLEYSLFFEMRLNCYDTSRCFSRLFYNRNCTLNEMIYGYLIDLRVDERSFFTFGYRRSWKGSLWGLWQLNVLSFGILYVLV